MVIRTVKEVKGGSERVNYERGTLDKGIIEAFFEEVVLS